MNILEGKIKGIQQSGAILLADLDVKGHSMSALLTEGPFSSEWLKLDAAVIIAFKETEVSLMKNCSGMISLRNQLPCTITGVETGEILGCVKLHFMEFSLTAALTSRSIASMQIKPGDEIVALIKANEISILRVSEKSQSF